MTTAIADPKVLSDSLIAAVHRTHERLLGSPFYARLLAGTLCREDYAAWLVQHYKFVQHTVPLIRGLADSMASQAQRDDLCCAIFEFGSWQAGEEAGHDILALMDLAALWGVNQTEALGLVHEAETSPPVAAYCEVVDMLLARHPHGILGVGVAFETLSGLLVDSAREGFRTRSRIEGIHDALAYLDAHCSEIENEHAERGCELVDRLKTPAHKSAATFFGKMALAMYEEMIFFLDEQQVATPSR